VVGIAGHVDLKRVGRMGIKALVYFDIVSTLALLIGFAAIKITRAGSGLWIPSNATEESLTITPHSPVELITNIFPESIAKSVAEG
jgi:proton glutamate symport protein